MRMPKFSVHRITQSPARSRWAADWFNTFNNPVLSCWAMNWLFLHLHFCVHYRYCPIGLWIGMSLSIISFAVLLHLSLLVYQSILSSNMTTNILLRTLIIYHSSYKILFSIPLYSHFHNTIHIFDEFVWTYLHPLCLLLDRSFINDLSTHLRG